MNDKDFDNFDKILFNEFSDNFKITSQVEKKINDTLKSIRNKNSYGLKYKITNLLKRIAIVSTSIVTIFGGYCFAKIIIKNYFYTENNGIESAANNGYIYNVNSDYSISNGNKLKISNILMDDYTLNLSFDMILNSNIETSLINDILFSDILITDNENNILYANNEDSFNKYCLANDLNYSFMDYKDGYLNTGVNWYIQHQDNNSIKVIYNFTPTGLTKYPNSKVLNVCLKNFKTSKNSDEINGEWNFSIELPDYFYNRTNISYLVNDDSNSIFKIKEFNVYNSCSKLIMEMPKPGNVVSEEEFHKLYTQFLEENDKKNEILKENPNADIPQTETEKKLLEIIDEKDKLYISNIFIENERGEKFYPLNASFENSGSYNIDNEKMCYWNTFNLTSNNLTDTLILHIEYNNKDYSFKLQQNL